MAYVDRQSGTSRATSLATVAVIHAGLGAVLLYGLATNVIVERDSGPLVATTFPTPAPTPPPTEEAIETPPSSNSVIDRPSTPIDLQPTLPNTRPTEQPTDTRPYIPPTPQPTWKPTVTPTPTFAIKRPRPTNDQSRWVTTDDYPAREIRLGHEGTTRFRVVVSSTGKVQECEITGSSGYPALDEAACRNVTKRAKFEAGSNAQGVKEVGTYSSTVVWRIPED